MILKFKKQYRFILLVRYKIPDNFVYNMHMCLFVLLNLFSD
jgi:hypothetical protein